MQERWSVGEIVRSKVAVRDENTVLVGWVLAQDAELVAAAPELLELLRALVEAADGGALGGATEALDRARALLGELSLERDVCPECEGSTCDDRGDPCPVCDAMGLVTVTLESGQGEEEAMSNSGRVDLLSHRS